jgi:hypothetical protein
MTPLFAMTDICGPWALGPPIRRDSHIFTTTTDPQWVIKRTPHLGEISAVTRIHVAGMEHVTNAVELHEWHYACCGVTADDCWYAMRRYEGDASATFIAGADIAVATLAFLRDLHTNLLLVHGDIKATNVLYRDHGRILAVSDYGLTDNPWPRTLRNYPVDHQWYYALRGCDLDGAPLSWRMDLIALGYLLLDKDWPMECPRTYQEIGGTARVEASEELDPEWIALRNEEVAAALAQRPLVADYFARVTEHVGWMDRAPPSREFYDRLAEMFH